MMEFLLTMAVIPLVFVALTTRAALLTEGVIRLKSTISRRRTGDVSLG